MMVAQMQWKLKDYDDVGPRILAVAQLQWKLNDFDDFWFIDFSDP